jgi:hypothetical protein
MLVQKIVFHMLCLLFITHTLPLKEKVLVPLESLKYSHLFYYNLTSVSSTVEKL